MFKWQQLTDGTWRAEHENISLNAVPVAWKRGKPARGTKWRACVSAWDAATRCMSRYGRDVYFETVENAKEARALAERVYSEAPRA